MEGRTVAGPVDGGDAGRQAVGAVRAHDARHRNGRRRADQAARRRRPTLFHVLHVMIDACIDRAIGPPRCLLGGQL